MSLTEAATSTDRLLSLIQDRLRDRRPVSLNDPDLVAAMADRTPFWGIAICLYQPGHDRLLVVRAIPDNSSHSAHSAINRVLKHPRFPDFDLSTDGACRIQVDIIRSKPVSARINDLRSLAMGPSRFETGVDGLRMEFNGSVRYMLPGDGFVFSILSLNHLYSRIQRLFPGVNRDDLIVTRFRSRSWVTCKGDWLQLYRGYPVVKNVTTRDMLEAALASIDNVLRTRKSDGRFEYYYDARSDSRRNHEHPKRDPDKDPYYNMLRHCGGALTLLFCADALRNPSVLADMPELLSFVATTGDSQGQTVSAKSPEAVRNVTEQAIDYFLTTTVEYQLPDGNVGAYGMCNRKAKLGGAGLGLYMLTEYRRLYNDSRYDGAATKLARHLVNEIQPSGEFRYYHVYLDMPVPIERNQLYFSFYYPGEALIGLAGYARYVCTDDAERAATYEKMHKALEFLIVERPIRHKEHFESLPSDGWLMMAINDLWDIAQFRKPLYSGFVFNDADAMCDHQYNEKNSLYKDYLGSFFYSYGDHPYPDGARGEGLMGAYDLAVKVDDSKRIERYRRGLSRLIWSLMHLCNTAASTYYAKNPDAAIGGIRFKYTRQWFRIDTIQHVASLFFKYLMKGSSVD